jgi:hypothetical protein
MTARTWTRRSVPLVLTACILLAGPGCGSGNVPVAGDVTYEGQPIDDGAITFVSQGGEPETKASCHIAGGKYKFEADRGPAPGKYRVEVTWLKKTGKKVPTGDGDPQDEKVQVLPAKFNVQSTLTAEVKSGTRKLDFALTAGQ